MTTETKGLCTTVRWRRVEEWNLGGGRVRRTTCTTFFQFYQWDPFLFAPELVIVY